MAPILSIQENNKVFDRFQAVLDPFFAGESLENPIYSLTEYAFP